MLLRLTPVLCIFLLAGCTSSEPENMSPAPIAESTVIPGAPTTPTLVGQTAGEPGQMPLGEPVAPATAQHGYNCRTVGNATMCDAPAVSPGEDRLYTN